MQKFVKRCRKLVGLLGSAGAGSVEAYQPVATQGLIGSSSHAPSSFRLVGEEEEATLKEICPRGNNKLSYYYYISLFMIIVYYPCYNCIDRKFRYMCGYIDNPTTRANYRRS